MSNNQYQIDRLKEKLEFQKNLVKEIRRNRDLAMNKLYDRINKLENKRLWNRIKKALNIH